MPLYKEWNFGSAHAAIWKMEEPEFFFKEHTGLSPDIKNDKRRIEHLAGRFLLKYLRPDFPLLSIAKDSQDKPRIPGNSLFFSISHSWPYAAAVVDTSREAGIDLQTWHPRIQQLQYKFLSGREQQLFNNEPKLIALAWAAKEAAYKWMGSRGVDFIEHLPIENFTLSEEKNQLIINNKLSANSNKLTISNVYEPDFICCYVNFTTYF